MTVDLKVEVDLSDIDTDDIISELSERNLTKQQSEEVVELLNIEKPIDLPSLSMIDRAKYDLFVENLEKITLEQIENLLK